MPLEHVTAASTSIAPSAAGRRSSNVEARDRHGTAGRSTSSPARTRAYARLPSTLIADTDDGTCAMSPVSGERRLPHCPTVTRRRVGALEELALGVVGRSSTPPAGSSRRSPCRPARWPSRRVARLTPRTSTPVAIGSSVPAWPTFRVPASRRTRPTTSCDVQPDGLVDDDQAARRGRTAHSLASRSSASSRSSSASLTLYGSGSPAYCARAAFSATRASRSRARSRRSSI